MNYKPILLSIAGAFIFLFLFLRSWLGINLFIFDALILFALFYNQPLKKLSQNTLIAASGFAISATAFLFVYSAYAFVVNLFTFGLLMGMVIYPQAKSFMTAFRLAFLGFFLSQFAFFKSFNSLRIKGRAPFRFIKRITIFIIPIIIIFIFISIYRNSNPFFDKYFDRLAEIWTEYVVYIFRNMDADVIFVFIVGLIISVYVFFRVGNQTIIHHDMQADMKMIRKRTKPMFHFHFVSLKNEYKAAVFLLVILNAILLIVNLIDINYVWFNFQWNGQYLKQFVHEGTYLLILSILLAGGVILFYFRRNLNFYPKNRNLKRLSYIWLAQNIILAVSVGIRNFYYIQYFALAYKRIAVLVFLVLAIFALYSVYIKVSRQKSVFYLLKVNSLALFIALVSTSVVNWDILIARYNIAHSDSAFLHLDFMAHLSPKALPYIDLSAEQLSKIDSIQDEKFDFEVRYLSSSEYLERIHSQKISFIKQWENKKWNEWNFAEYRAYKLLTDK